MSEKKELATTGEKKPKRKRPDRTEACSVHTEPGDNRRYLQHSMKIFAWPEVDMKEPEAVKARVMEYFAQCEQDDMKPSVAGMAMAFAAALDAMKWHEVVGCVAGDDTVMCAIRTKDDALVIVDRIKKIATSSMK